MMKEQQIVVKDKIHEKTIKIAPFRKDIRKTVAHKHNSYFELIYLSGGQGYHTIDSVEFAITPPMAFFIRQEQTHHWELETEPEGYVLILKRKFVEDCLDKQLHKLLIQASASTCVVVSDQPTVEDLFKLLLREFDPERGGGGPVIEGLLKALLAKLVDESPRGTSGKSHSPSLFQDYEALLSRNSMLKNSVSYYATYLNTTPQNLNAACRKAVGQPAAAVLSHFIVNEAKRLLTYTSLPVAEVAIILDFKDSSHFIKYFKRHTGYTPVTYRSQI
jgi:AraC family transcriptional regulator, transcriptional activator of pobA